MAAGNSNAKKDYGPRIVISVQQSFESPRSTNCSLGTSNDASNMRTQSNVLHVFVTAHPDDESMFFLPTISALLKAGETVWLLCLTTGNYDGLGDKRKRELSRVCALLKIHKLVCLDNTEIQDHPTKSWSLDCVASLIEGALNSALSGMEGIYRRIVLVTFDIHGVSGHINHRDTYLGVRNLVLQQQKKKHMHHKQSEIVPSYEAWQLDTVHFLPAKYLPIGEWCLVLLCFCLLWQPNCKRLPDLSGKTHQHLEEDQLPTHTYRSANPLLSWKAMATHQSQFVWYRRLFVVFSCYTFINRLRPIK